MHRRLTGSWAVDEKLWPKDGVPVPDAGLDAGARDGHQSAYGYGARTEMKKSRRRSPKAVLRLPDLEHAKSAVLNSLASPESRRSYEFAIQTSGLMAARRPILRVADNPLTEALSGNLE